MKNNEKLVTFEERQWIAKNAIIEMGKRIRFKIIDLDKASEKLLKDRESRGVGNIIIIKQISENMFKDLNIRSSYHRDDSTGVYYGIPLSEDDYGNIQWQKMILPNAMTLNLNNINDLKLWTVLRFNPNIKGSPFQLSKPIYEVMDPSVIAKREINEAQALKKAFGVIDTIIENHLNMIYFARYLNNEIINEAKYEVIYGLLLRHAQKNPLDFIAKYNDPDRPYLQIIESARQNMIIQTDDHGQLSYEGVPLGVDDRAAVKTIAKDNTLKTAILERLSKEDIAANDLKLSFAREKSKK